MHVVVPILVSRIHYVASDVDAELRDARERLDATLAWARAEGLAVTGKVGDPNIALGAIEDELRLAGADEVIIATLPRGRSNWPRPASSSGCARTSTSPSRTPSWILRARDGRGALGWSVHVTLL